ncbi:hypothetical protein DICPUDRAFT_147443 [Dictyostelium purpureum]|uniref:Pre-mRNA-splicing factor SYF2 n=1 Tax=Dictyostelium purpureum TaxID=5786 RepID=F0Z8H7_DICPU|nr:uncharacterized protein DICPUDRAFT_147443 [Dictyostelium purpureum]EGC39758.1 hypothetical protein DICPUDRAFT_147443 [Dictyostelium purpureum]|eukprot:XP_003283744.1 hypothetical protein DICPUDRAFT_147443 [Dictyostelium purpureum]
MSEEEIKNQSIDSLKEEIDLHDNKNKKYIPKESYNAVSFDYSKEDEKAKNAHLPKKFTKENNIDNHYIDPTENLTPQQKKIYELRKKLENSKNSIYKTVVDEHKRIHQGAQDEIDEKRKIYKEKVKQEEEEMKKQGLDPEKEKLRNIVADDIKTKKKTGKKYDKDSYTDEHVYKSYKKRVKEMESFHNSEHFKPVVSDSSESLETVEYGKSSVVPRGNINAMKQELLKNQEQRNSFKRKGINDEEDVNYVNESNRIYNKKVSRAYDKYTLETRQNLERGTAL